VVNFTGTPYVNNKLISDVVYYFGLKQGIEEGILKRVNFVEYENVKSDDFVSEVVNVFTNRYQGLKLEGKLPKIAFYSSSIEDLQQNLRPLLEKILSKKGIPLESILEYHTEKEESRDEFLKLDTDESKKQFILLVGKGTEGWNVRSLVATALYRKPTSAIFVLQASTRCMRSIGDNSTFATIFLSDENALILDKELQRNFSVTRADLEQQNVEKLDLTLNVLKTRKIKVKKILTEIKNIENKKLEDIKLKPLGEYIKSSVEGIKKEGGIKLNEDSHTAFINKRKEVDIKWEESQQSYIHFVANLSLKTHVPCLDVEEIFKANNIDNCDCLTNRNSTYVTNSIANDITSQLYKYEEERTIVEEELELTKNFPFKLSRDKNRESLVVYQEDLENGRLGFHINPYSFDTTDEKELFLYLREILSPDEVVIDLYFTGNVTDSVHTDFFFEYWNPSKEKISRYFPDFLIETSKGRFIVIEVKEDDKKIDYSRNKEDYEKGDRRITNEVFAKELGFRDFQKQNPNFDYHIIFNARLQQKQKELLEKLNLES